MTAVSHIWSERFKAASHKLNKEEKRAKKFVPYSVVPTACIKRSLKPATVFSDMPPFRLCRLRRQRHPVSAKLRGGGGQWYKLMDTDVRFLITFLQKRDKNEKKTADNIGAWRGENFRVQRV
jgi:hypothetical protein